MKTDELVKEVKELLLSEEDSIRVLTACGALIRNNLPENLCRYRPFLRDHDFDALVKGYEYMATAQQYNDPFDATIFRSFEKDRNKALADLYSDLVKDFLSKLSFIDKKDLYSKFFDMDLAVSYFRKNAKDVFPEYAIEIFCENIAGLMDDAYKIVKSDFDRRQEVIDEFCEDVRSKFMHCTFSEFNYLPHMWAYYADNHCGACINYNPVNVFECSGQIFPTIYSQRLQESSELIEDFLNGERNLKKLFLASITKLNNWSHEKEWRAIKIKDDNSRKVDGLKAESVILGINCRDDRRDKIIEICNDESIPLFQMSTDRESSRLKTEPLYF